MYKESYRHLPAKFKKRILLLPFENFFSQTDELVIEIGKFLGKKPVKEMPAILKKVEMPKNGAHSQACLSFKEATMCYACKLKEIEKIAPKKYFDILVNLKKEYEAGQTY